MRRCLFVQHGILFAQMGLCLASAGCMGGYAFPRYIAVPQVAVGGSRKDVRAFRLEISERSSASKASCGRRILTPLAIDKNGVLASQRKTMMESAWGMTQSTASGLPERQSNAMRVILYRPGYRTIKLGSGERQDQVQWQETTTPEEAEQAVDALTGCKGCDLSEFNQVLKELVPGAYADGHRDALLFAALEYERVSGLISWEQKDKIKMRYRLTDKAAKLRVLAGK